MTIISQHTKSYYIPHSNYNMHHTALIHVIAKISYSNNNNKLMMDYTTNKLDYSITVKIN